MTAYAAFEVKKGKTRTASKQRTLSERERSALFLGDGIRTRGELVDLFLGDIGLLQKLMSDGYLVPTEALSLEPAARMTDWAASITAPAPLVAAPRVAAPTPIAPSGPPAAPKSSSDNFEGKRSLATTRMFLLDIVERMFVRKMPELANSLREARDRESMMVIARDIIVNVEEIAGPDRADGLSERLAMMLPPE